MVEQFLNHINRSALCKTTDKILLAVSGGVDSMVMMDLFRQTGFRIGVAHCNFQLRANESDEDAALVEAVCRQFAVPCYVKRFDTENIAKANRVSIQMAARDLRYNYFEQLATSHGYDLIATAHHFDDTIESVLLNLVRGTGIDGLRGIASRKANIIRPLLFANREIIFEYARSHKIQWREDASNATDDYARNFVRHQVIPRMQEINPSFHSSFRDTHERLLAGREYALTFIEKIRSTGVQQRADNSMTIDIGLIRRSPYPAVLLWELIKELGFRYDHCKRITEDHQPGKLFFSDTHQLVVDRDLYLIEARKPRQFATCVIERGQLVVGMSPFSLTFQEIGIKEFALHKDTTIAQLDADRVQYPLVWRKWQSGDYFIPLGMRGEKKVSDFLIDLKMPFNEKADVTVLESAGTIVWVVGLRIHEHYKVTAETTRVLIVENGSGDGKK